MLIDWQTIIVGVSYLAAFFGFVAALIKFLKSQGLLPVHVEEILGKETTSAIEDAMGNPVVELATGTLGMLRNWIVQTNPAIIENAAQRVVHLIPNHAKTDNKVFKFIIENDEQLFRLVMDFYNAVRDIASDYGEV